MRSVEELTGDSLLADPTVGRDISLVFPLGETDVRAFNVLKSFENYVLLVNIILTYFRLNYR